jgi:Skp family chaperone for outer membrane proteins
MKTHSIATFGLGAAVAIAGFLAGSADARRSPAVPSAPAPIGVVNLATVFDKLDASAEWDLRIKTLESRATEEAAKRRSDLEATGKALEALGEGPEKERKLDEYRLQQIQNEQWAGFKEIEVDRELSLKWKSIYGSVREGAKRLAQSENLALVIVDDSGVEIRTQRTQNGPKQAAQAQAQIMQLRVLYADRTVDVTEKLIVQLNNARSLAPSTNSSGSATPAGSKP